MRKNNSGFTLLEILIALFVFTILSMILMSALHNIINIATHTEQKTEQLRDLQMALLLMSRDIEQAVDRPIRNSNGSEDPAFLGTAEGFMLTHTGLQLRRVRYFGDDHGLWRVTFSALDLLPQTKIYKRRLLENISEAEFTYLDKDKHFHATWPAEGVSDSLPRAVRIHLTIKNWGKISQLYVIASQSKNEQKPPPKS